jgi:glycosyltransferase involved in cell wall biosynthesis
MTAAGTAHASPRLDLLVPGDLETPTGGYIYDREVLARLAAAGWSCVVHRLDDSFPQPTPSALRGARAAFASVPDGGRAVIDGLALPGLDRVLREHAARLALIALVHHPIALETGLDAVRAERFAADERRALALVRRVIVTSQWTARALARFDVPLDKIRVAEPGVDARMTAGPAAAAAAAAAEDAEPRAHGDGVNLLCVATLTPRKGHALLFDALAELRDRRWHLTCAGSFTRDPDTAAALERQLARLSLKSRVSLLGDLDAALLERHYARADVFVLPSYLEGYGMALAEAAARGLPVVSTTGGAIPETVPAESSVLVPPGDSRALAKALAPLLDDPAARAKLAAAARAARVKLPTWHGTAQKFAAALSGLDT